MGRENEDWVRCVIYTSLIDEDEERVEQVPVGVATAEAVITIGNEPGSNFRIKSIGNCKIIFGQNRAIVKANSPNIFLKEKGFHKNFPNLLEEEEEVNEWEQVETNKGVRNPGQFGVRVGNHDFFFKNVKMMDLYDNKKLSTVKGVINDFCVSYASTLLQMELRIAVAEQLRTDKHPESIYTIWRKHLEDVANRRKDLLVQIVEQALVSTKGEVDKKISIIELNIDFEGIARQLLEREYPKISRECLGNRPVVDNTPVLEPLREMEERLVSLGENFTQYEETQLGPLRDSCDELRQSLTVFRQRREAQKQKQLDWKKKVDKSLERGEKLLEGWRKRRIEESCQGYTSQRSVKRRVEESSKKIAPSAFEWENEAQGELEGGFGTFEEYVEGMEELVRRELELECVNSGGK